MHYTFLYIIIHHIYKHLLRYRTTLSNTSSHLIDGFLVREGDIDDLARKIMLLIESEDLRKQMGTKPNEKCMHYTFLYIIIHHIYKHLLRYRTTLSNTSSLVRFFLEKIGGELKSYLIDGELKSW